MGVIPYRLPARVLVAVAIAILLGGLFALFEPVTTSALTTVPTKINFQGRLTDSSGNIVANGSYNVKFLLYTVSSGGTSVWNETRENNGTDTRVVVTNGLFSVQLGDATSIPASLFSSGNLYLEIVMATPATATCSTAGCASWESAMSPRNPLATSAYAFNAETLDGIDSSAFGQLSANNLFTGTNQFKLTDPSAVNIQDAGGTSLLLADTSNTVVKIGNPGTATLSNVRLLTTNAEVTSTLRIGNLTDGVEFNSGSVPLYRGNARPTRVLSMAPEYPGATFTADGSNNNGSLSSDFCSGSSRLNINSTVCTGSTDEHNYYQWTTTQGTAQDYDVYVRFKMPSDYDTGSMANLTAVAWGTSTSNESAVLSFYSPGSATACTTTSNLVTSSGAWSTPSVTASPLGLCTINANDMITVKIHLVATNASYVRMGEFSFEYRSKF